jgi:hypothetical protein
MGRTEPSLTHAPEESETHTHPERKEIDLTDTEEAQEQSFAAAQNQQATEPG